jgi:hydrogenase nickel incorporation protein HypA/HybF
MKTPRELQTMQSIFDQAIRRAQENPSSRVASLHIVIGEIAEVDRDSIWERWRELSCGTPAQDAQLHFRVIAAEVQCMACFKKYHPENGTIHCPNCGSFGAKILAGEEFHLDSIEMDNGQT